MSDVCAALTAAGFAAIEQHGGGEGSEAFHVLTAHVPWARRTSVPI